MHLDETQTGDRWHSTDIRPNNNETLTCNTHITTKQVNAISIVPSHDKLQTPHTGNLWCIVSQQKHYSGIT